MGDRMRPPTFAALMERVLSEKARQESAEGARGPWKAEGGRVFSFLGEPLESPVGPAAGPHTQLAGNIIAAYLAGGRFFELKTVQALDGEDLHVAKPCILAQDEGYNCEWSTELTVPQAMDEYIKAWYALKLLSREWGLGSTGGFMFNMSVGYTLEGIKSAKIDCFIEGLKDASSTEAFADCRAWALGNLARFKAVDRSYVDAVDPHVCKSVTLSTLHGCPAGEIERIVSWLMEGKGLHTFVKLNPTLLGYDVARNTLDSLGYGAVSFGDFHFRDDLQYADALQMLRRLNTAAQGKGLALGVKLSNTLPVDVRGGELPAAEMYLSGRALFPLTVSLAAKLARDLGAELPISFSGGADARNIAGLVSTGVFPVTAATTLLKPGGYERLGQLADLASRHAADPGQSICVEELERLAEDAAGSALYRKSRKPLPSRKAGGKVPLLDCFQAGCRSGCPIGQDIPAYLHLAEQGDWLAALRVIVRRNPLPFVTGTLCPSFCRDKCARGWYEEPVDIRGVKLACAGAAYDDLMKEIKPGKRLGRRAAVVGAGPAGLSCAFFLARAGCDVTVFEKSGVPGGLIHWAVPGFRLHEADLARDVALCLRPGVDLQLNSPISDPRALLEQGYDAVVLCVGACAADTLSLREGSAMEALEFLRKAKHAPGELPAARNIAVIGGGNSAIDAARAAMKLAGVQQVSLVYRRTARYMPAAEEELEEALAEGIAFLELLSPISWDGRLLQCRKMTLGEADKSGRRSVVETEELSAVPADLVIAAIGEKPDAGFYSACGLPLDTRGLPIVDPDTLESPVKGVYVAGDGRQGPATVVEAIADASRAAEAIVREGLDSGRYEAKNKAVSLARARARRGEIRPRFGQEAEASRCLQCAVVCENCVEVCPNRANVSIHVKGRLQIVHLDALCNACGNCETFCPYDSAPYREKLTLFPSKDDFVASENPGFLPLGNTRFLIRLDGQVSETGLDEDHLVSEDLAEVMREAARLYGAPGEG